MLALWPDTYRNRLKSYYAVLKDPAAGTCVEAFDPKLSQKLMKASESFGRASGSFAKV
jgi:hypothetical protein